jgi:cell division protein FtsW
MITRHQIDYVILILFIFLVAFGFIMLASASSDMGKIGQFEDVYYYLKHQINYGLSIGIVGFLAGFLISYKRYKKLSPLFLAISLAALVLVFTPLGFSSGGAQRWLQIGVLTIHPAEILKLSFTIYLAAWLSGSRSNRGNNLFEGLLPFLVVSGLITLLLIIQRNTSSVVTIMMSALVIYFTSGAKKRYVLAIIAMGGILLSLVIYLTPYRLERIMTYLDPSKDEKGSGYQIKLAKNAISSGGFFGKGYGKSDAKRYIPEKIGDSIYAIIAEEFGFVGSIGIIVIFLVFITRGFLLAKKIHDQFGKLLLVGFSTIIGIQVFMHIGAISGVIPLTGVPLPFISYGGTALAVFMTMTGIILNISKNA